MLGVNMQTSFMHPPFGFALFYLRSVAPTEPYIDRVSGKRMEPVTTAQIYWGAIPFVVIQCIMVGAGHRLPIPGHALQDRRAPRSIPRKFRLRSICPKRPRRSSCDSGPRTADMTEPRRSRRGLSNSIEASPPSCPRLSRASHILSFLEYQQASAWMAGTKPGP